MHQVLEPFSDLQLAITLPVVQAWKKALNNRGFNTPQESEIEACHDVLKTMSGTISALEDMLPRAVRARDDNQLILTREHPKASVMAQWNNLAHEPVSFSQLVRSRARLLANFGTLAYAQARGKGKVVPVSDLAAQALVDGIMTGSTTLDAFALETNGSSKAVMTWRRPDSVFDPPSIKINPSLV